MRPIVQGAWVLVLALGAARVPALAQPAGAVSTDESVIGPDAIIRVGELRDVGNVGEAVRVLQSLLDAEGDHLLASPADPDLFISVRSAVHERLLASRDLLDKYRTAEGPRALQMLSRDELAELERTRLLTPSGFEAALRLAQLDIENARFEAARLMLAQLERHPERLGDRRCAGEAAMLAATTASFLGRPDVRAWALRWAQEAALNPAPAIEAVPPPAAALARARGVLEAGPALPGAIPPNPLQSVSADARGQPGAEDRADRPVWVFPSVMGDTVYVNDGERVWAWDSATLSLLWASESGASAPTPEAEGMFTLVGPQGWSEDASTVTAGSGVVVAPMGLPENGLRRGDRRVQAFEAASGRLLWAVDPSELDDSLLEAVVRGPAVIDGDTVVLSVRKASAVRRTSALFMIGLDLFNGRLKWSRLVGSVGTNPWGRAQVRPDGAVADRGVVYRGDDMGVIGAYEAATGRPVWVRVTRAPRTAEMNITRVSVGVPPFEMQRPVVVGDDLFFVEPGRERVLRLSAADGMIRASRDSSALGEPRYLLLAGRTLVAVGPARLMFVGVDEFEQGSVQPSAVISGNAIKGRVIVAGERVVVPTDSGLLVLDPGARGEESKVVLPTTGNVVIAGGEGSSARTHVLVNDTHQLHTYVSWEEAQALLDQRVADAPGDPGPLLTYVELVHRSGHASRVPALADAALKLVTAPGQASRRGRAKLFELLIAIVRDAHAQLATAQAPAAAPLSAPVVRDLALLDAIAERLPACAESAPELTAQFLERAWIRELQGRPQDAAEAYQQVLLDSGLAAAVPFDQSERPGGEVARAALASLLLRVGPAAYSAFDEEARAALQAIPAGADARDFETLARRYPVAECTPEAWRLGALARLRAGEHDAARIDAGQGLTAAELSAAMGRPDQLPTLGRLAGALLTLATGPSESGAVYRTLRRLAREHPGLRIEAGAGTQDASAAADAAGEAIRARLPLPRLGRPSPGPGRVIEGWEPIEPLVKRQPGVSTDSAVMINESKQEAALWALSAEDGQLREVWSRAFKSAPTAVRVGHDQTLLYWPSLTGGSLEAVGLDGQTVWRTPEFLTFFDSGPNADPNDRIPTPLEGHVRPESLVMSLDTTSVVLVQRTGLAVAIDLATGRPLWHKALDLTRVYDVAHAGGQVIAIGATRGLDGQLVPAVVGVDAATGAPKSRLPGSVMGDHPRWVRPLPSGDVIVATSDGLVRFDPGEGLVRWTAKSGDLRASTDGWVVGGAVFVLDSELRLWRVALEGGAVSAAPIDTKDKLTLPVAATVRGQDLVLATAQGVVVVHEDGRLIGADTLESAQLEPAVVGETCLMTIESPQREMGLGEGIGGAYRLVLMEYPSGRQVASDRVRLYESPRVVMGLDGKVLVGQGVATFVFDAPSEATSPEPAAPR